MRKKTSLKLWGFLLIFAAVFMAPINAPSQNFSLQGQMSGWLTLSSDGAAKSQIGLRYIPNFSLTKSFQKEYALDAEISFNAFGSAQILSLDNIQTQGKVKPYRLWLRFSTAQFEARLGLQKINFGSALLLRPLMWFDRVDPNDPLQLTDGVYGLLFKYTFLNNANIWLWGLYGNDKPKGWETIPSQNKSVECGGRFQFPLLKGEMAFSSHHRRMDPSRSLDPQILLNEKNVAENRFSLDGRWDIGLGVWFEAVLIHQDFKSFPLKYLRDINLGLDYTFDLGRGLHLMGEQLIIEASEKALGKGKASKFSVASLDYPLGLLDRIKVMVFHDWENKDWYRFFTWQRMYDRWSFYLIGFWNPEHYQIYSSQTGKNLFAGKGFQLMVAFNH